MNHWLNKYLPDDARQQKQKLLLWLNALFAVICLLYINANTAILDKHLYATIFTTLAYLGLTLFTAFQINHTPVSLPRLLLTLIPNIAIVFTILILDSSFTNGATLLVLALVILATYTYGIAGLMVATTATVFGIIIYSLSSQIPFASLLTEILEFLMIAMAGLIIYRQQAAGGAANALNLNYSPVATFTFTLKDNQPYIVETNTIANQLFPAGKHGVQELSRIAIAADTDELSNFCRNSFMQQQPATLFIRGNGLSGTTRQLMCVAHTLPAPHNNIGICMAFDITDSEMRWSQLASNTRNGQVSTLVATIIHDFRNILTTIIGTAEVLEFTLTDQNALEQVGRIIASGDMGSEKISNLLAFDTMGRKSRPAQAVEIKPAILQTAELLRLQLPGSITLECQFNGELPPLFVDYSAIEIILSNLVNNAKEAIAHTGKIIISVSSDQDANGSTNLQLAVTDNGRGIAENDIPLVTQSLWSTKKNQGAGLGLSIVKRTVNKSGGTLEISSSEKVGTRVSITLPEYPEQGAETIKNPAAEEKVSADANQKKMIKTKPCSVLLVDDNTDVLASQRLLVEAMGHKTRAATSGIEGIEIYKEHKDDIQLVITDFKMPRMDGIELAIELRKENPDLPIIMLTGYGESSKLSQCKELDISLILKPCGFQKLTDTILEVQNKNPDIFS